MKTFEQSVKEEVNRIRNMLKQVEAVNSFEFRITANGRVCDGEVKIEFRLSPDMWGSDSVRGGAIEPVVMEMLRRKGWDDRNTPLMLTSTPEQAKTPATKPELAVDNE